MPKKQVAKNKHKKITTIVMVIGVVLLLALLFDLSPFGGNIRFYSKWKECGMRPVIGHGSGYFNSEVPSYSEAPQFALSRQDTWVYCTPLEAEEHGFSASSKKYEAPELKKRYGDNYCLTATSPKSETTVQFPYCGQK